MTDYDVIMIVTETRIYENGIENIDGYQSETKTYRRNRK